MIAAHADRCAETQKGLNIMLRDHTDNQVFDVDAPLEDLYHQGDSSNDAVITNAMKSEDMSKELNLMILNCGRSIEEESLNITIFRGSCFKDFYKYFLKPWNMAKKSLRYTYNFAGESGIDEGGVSREFYTGIEIMNDFSIITFVYVVLSGIMSIYY